MSNPKHPRDEDLKPVLMMHRLPNGGVEIRRNVQGFLASETYGILDETELLEREELRSVVVDRRDGG